MASAIWIPANLCYPLTASVLGAAATGQLRALQNFVVPMAQGLSGVLRLAQPYFSARAGEGSRESIPAIWRMALIAMAGACLYLAAVTVFREPLMGALYRGKFAEAVPLLPWMVLSGVLAAGVESLAVGLRALRGSRQLLGAYAVAAIIYAAGGVPLARAAGPARCCGAAGLGLGGHVGCQRVLPAQAERRTRGGRAMNILVWNSWVTPAGGMERVAMSIAGGLAERGAAVTLAGPFSAVPTLKSRIHPRVSLVDCPFERRAGALVGNAMLLRRVVRERQIDVVSAHGSLIPLLPLSVPVVWTEHGPRYGDGKILAGLRGLPWRAVQAKLRSGSWKFVACSRYVRDRICAELGLPAERAAVILNGVPNAEALTSLAPPAFREPFQIGFLGRVEPEKYPLDIFTLDQEMERRGVPCQWHIFGEGSLAAQVRERAAGHPRIRVRGLAASPAEAFAQMDVLAFLSHGQMEGLPTVILEARLARRRVVAWDVTANPEAAGPDDRLAAPFDLTGFAAAIEDAVRERKAPAPVGDEISYGRMIDKYWDVLAGMSNGRARGVAQPSPARGL